MATVIKHAILNSPVLLLGCIYKLSAKEIFDVEQYVRHENHGMLNDEYCRSLLKTNIHRKRTDHVQTVTRLA